MTGGFASCAASPIHVLIKFNFEGDHSIHVHVSAADLTRWS